MKKTYKRIYSTKKQIEKEIQDRLRDGRLAE